MYVCICVHGGRGRGVEGCRKGTATALGEGLGVVLAFAWLLQPCVWHTPSPSTFLERSGSCGEADHLLPLPVSLLDCEMNKLLEESEDFWDERTLDKERPWDAGRPVGPCPSI